MENKNVKYLKICLLKITLNIIMWKNVSCALMVLKKFLVAIIWLAQDAILNFVGSVLEDVENFIIKNGIF